MLGLRRESPSESARRTTEIDLTETLPDPYGNFMTSASCKGYPRPVMKHDLQVFLIEPVFAAASVKQTAIHCEKVQNSEV